MCVGKKFETSKKVRRPSHSSSVDLLPREGATQIKTNQKNINLISKRQFITYYIKYANIPPPLLPVLKPLQAHGHSGGIGAGQDHCTEGYPDK